MKRSMSLPAAMLASFVLVGPALAEDQVIDVKPCHFFCGLWRNVSRNAQVTFVKPIDNAGRIDPRPPAATEGAQAPSVRSLVAKPGSVMIGSPAEQAATRRQRAAMQRELDRGGPNKAAAAR